MAFILATSDAASIRVDEKLKQDVHKQMSPSSVEFPSGVRLTPVGFISDEYIDPNNAGTSLFDSSGISSTYILQTFKSQSSSLTANQMMIHNFSTTGTFVCLLGLLNAFSVSAQHLQLE